MSTVFHDIMTSNILTMRISSVLEDTYSDVKESPTLNTVLAFLDISKFFLIFAFNSPSTILFVAKGKLVCAVTLWIQFLTPF